MGIEHEDFGYGDMNLLDIKKCYASKDIDIPNNIIFRNVNFLGERSFNIQTPLVDFQSCEGNRSDSLPSFNVKDGRVNGCNFEMALHVDAEKSLSVTECFDVDRRVEALVDRNGVNGFFFSYEDLTGYDMRKTLGTLDLSIPENQDLLEDSVKLKEVFADNKYIKNIIVNERMSEEVKDILGKYAPNINYSYTTDLSGIYGFNENLEEHVNFEKFMDGERVFDSIVAGMDENLSELEKFKYIYNELGKLVSYDINVLRDKNEDIDSYNRANLTARNLFSSVLSGKGVCAVYADMYMYVCKKAGLSCKREGGANHAYNVIQYIGNDGELVSSYCDLTLDSSRIKGNLNCRWFGKSVKSFVGHVGMTFEDAKDISEEAVMAIDKKLGYEYKRKLYLDVVREALELDGKEERVGFLLENMMQVQDISSMDNHEVMKLVLLVLGSCEMDPKDFGVTSAFIRRDMRQDKDVRDILWVRDKDENENERYLYYTFNSLQQRFKSLDYDVVDELLAAGMMEFYKGQKLPGFENWISEKEYKERRTSNMEH